MNYNKIINPLTGRKVNITSKLGKKILKNYLNQLGGAKNPHTGEEWSSYKCKGLSEDDCGNLDNFPRCTWVEATAKKAAHCKKTQRASRKRGQKNWKKAKSAIKERINFNLQSERLSVEEAEELLSERGIDPESERGQTLIADLVTLRYDPDYTSAFTGRPINKFTVREPEHILWWQASDKLDSNNKYGDDIGYGWLEDDEDDEDESSDGYDSFKKDMDAMDDLDTRAQDEADYLAQADPSDINPALDGMTEDEMREAYEDYMEDKKERNEIYHGF